MNAYQNHTSVTDSDNHLPKVVLGVVLTIMVVVTVCGNVVVCLVVTFNRQLRSLTNCFIVSLAVTDLLLGLLVLPFSAIQEISGKWVFGNSFCNIYSSLDVMLCTASILNLFMISLDRYYAVMIPLRYSMGVTPSRVAMAMVLIWTVSLMVSFLPIHLGWNTVSEAKQNRSANDTLEKCVLEVNVGYVLVDGLFTFYLPLLIMCITYYRIFKIAREQAKKINHVTCCNTVSHSFPIVKEHKATVTLAIVMGAFIVCWFPYFTVFMYRGINGMESVDEILNSFVTWLGYANSALNPILYAALNRDFRTAYQQLLWCRRLGPEARETCSLSQQRKDKSCKHALSEQEDQTLQLHVRNGKENALIQDLMDRTSYKEVPTSFS